MGAHIYCIVTHGREPRRDLAGVAGAPVAAARGARLAVWYSEHAAPPVPEPAEARAHHSVVASAMTPDFTPVPIRFGQWFASPDPALEQVVAEEAKWLEHLARFAGCAEYGVRIDDSEPMQAARDVHPACASGTAFMAALARRHADAQRRRAQGEEIAMRVNDAVRDLVVAARVEIPAAGLVRLAHLVAHQREGEYHAVLDEFRHSRSDLGFRFTGPWPPYSFVA